MKVVIFTTPCSGKSTFIYQYRGEYKGIKIYDWDENPVGRFPKENECLMDRWRTDTKLKIGVQYVIVKIPKKQLLSNIKKRQEVFGDHDWSNVANVLKVYDQLDYIQKLYGLEEFSSFQSALDALIEKRGIYEKNKTI